MDYFKDIYILIALYIPDGGTLKAWRMTCKQFRDMELDHLIEKYVDIPETLRRHKKLTIRQMHELSIYDAKRKLTKEQVLQTIKYNPAFDDVINKFHFSLQEVLHMNITKDYMFQRIIIHNPGLSFKEAMYFRELRGLDEYPTYNPNMTLDDLEKMPNRTIYAEYVIANPELFNEYNLSKLSNNGYTVDERALACFTKPEQILSCMNVPGIEKLSMYWFYLSQQKLHPGFVMEHLVVPGTQKVIPWCWYHMHPDNVTWDFILAHPELQWRTDPNGYSRIASKPKFPLCLYNEYKDEHDGIIHHYLDIPRDKMIDASGKLTKLAIRSEMPVIGCRNPMFTFDVMLANVEHFDIPGYTKNPNATLAKLMKHIHMKWDVDVIIDKFCILKKSTRTF